LGDRAVFGQFLAQRLLGPFFLTPSSLAPRAGAAMAGWEKPRGRDGAEGGAGAGSGAKAKETPAALINRLRRDLGRLDVRGFFGFDQHGGLFVSMISVVNSLLSLCGRSASLEIRSHFSDGESPGDVLFHARRSFGVSPLVYGR